MKQILQNLKTGQLLIEDIPAVKARPGHLLIQTDKTLISPGTERMLVDFGRANLFNKARQQPEKVKQALNKLKTDGLLPTFEAIHSKLDQPLPLGYCNVGRVLEVGHGVRGFKPGDMVASNGPHAEIVCVPEKLCAKIPPGVSNEEAVFTVISCIGLHGIRLLNASIGENVALFGLGLIGLISIQILKSSGINVLAFDYQSERVKIAQELGITALDLSQGKDPVKEALDFSKARGVDSVLVTASTKSNVLMSQAAQMCRKRGRIVLTGVSGLNLNRADFYEKEINFQVSCSYGPGRYDPDYEEKGHDYPFGYVRWTENRNMEAVLDLLQKGLIKVNPLISKRIDLPRVQEAYDMVAKGQGLGLILNFQSDSMETPNHKQAETITYAPSRPQAKVVAGIIGSGNFTLRQMLPALKHKDLRLKWIASTNGISSSHAAKKFGIEKSTTEAHAIIQDPEVNAVFITTRHDSHAYWTIKALEQGKAVFVEKPLCLNEEDLKQIIAAYEAQTQAGSSPKLMVGFNRRFSPLSQIIQKEVQTRTHSLAMTFTCNAGEVPCSHWTQDPKTGGGRILGEACHFIDLLRFFANAPISQVQAQKAKTVSDLDDIATISLGFKDGSLGTIHYFANGAKSYPKESAQLFFDGKTLVLNNFKSVNGFGCSISKKLLSQNKGHSHGFKAFIDSIITGAPAPIPFDQIIEVTRAGFEAVNLMQLKPL